MEDRSLSLRSLSVRTHPPSAVAAFQCFAHSSFSALILAAATLISCSSKPVVPDKPMKAETLQQEIGYAGFAQETVIDPVTTNATVVALDAAQRMITLKYANGTVAPYKA